MDETAEEKAAREAKEKSDAEAKAAGDAAAAEKARKDEAAKAKAEAESKSKPAAEASAVKELAGVTEATAQALLEQLKISNGRDAEKKSEKKKGDYWPW